MQREVICWCQCWWIKWCRPFTNKIVYIWLRKRQQCLHLIYKIAVKTKIRLNLVNFFDNYIHPIYCTSRHIISSSRIEKRLYATFWRVHLYKWAWKLRIIAKKSVSHQNNGSPKIYSISHRHEMMGTRKSIIYNNC